jgi:Undecaprenyl-phosphate glucose phosphotransferase
MNLVKPVSHVADAVVETLEPHRPRRKWPISYQSVSILAISVDIATILLVGVVSGAAYNLELFGASAQLLPYAGAAAVIAALFVAIMKAQDLYSQVDLLSLKTQIFSTLTAWFSVFLFSFGAAFALKISDQFSRGAIFSFATAGLALLLVERRIYRDFLSYGLRNSKFSGRNAIVITDAVVPNDAFAQSLLKHGFQLNRQFVLPPRIATGLQTVETLIAEVVAYVRGSDIEEVIVGIDGERFGDLEKLLVGLRVLPLPVSLVPTGTAANILNRPTYVMGNSICIELHRGPLGTIERGTKRLIDVVGSLTGLVLLFPLMVISAVMIKLDSPGPVFFRQRRCGFNGRQFSILKFRTMSVMEDGPTICQASKVDKRVTPVGRWLRRTSIDELPQLLNVLNGTMSLVGPRPHAVAHDNQFDKVVRNYAFRNHVKPGLTGWAQVNGHRGATPTVEDIQRRVQFDLWYIDNWSLRLDILILLRTCIEVVRGEAY